MFADLPALAQKLEGSHLSQLPGQGSPRLHELQGVPRQRQPCHPPSQAVETEPLVCVPDFLGVILDQQMGKREEWILVLPAVFQLLMNFMRAVIITWSC